MARDVDLTVLTGFGGEETFVGVRLRDYQFRPPGAMEMALTSRVLLLVNRRGTPVNVAPGGIGFEGRSIQRSSLWKIPEGPLCTCSAENLLVHKWFAGREQDWVDVNPIFAIWRSDLVRVNGYNERSSSGAANIPNWPPV